jgi:prefoldin subunit 5
MAKAPRVNRQDLTLRNKAAIDKRILKMQTEIRSLRNRVAALEQQLAGVR